MMKQYLVVVDMQNDFINGSLGTKEAPAIVPGVVNKIKGFDGKIFATYDTHFEDYLQTAEGKKLPVEHCIQDSEGWQIHPDVMAALQEKGFTPVIKHTFGSVDLPELIKSEAAGDTFSIELIGLCTDICVVSNALLLKAIFPEVKISVDADCCAGVTPQTHQAAIDTMRCCQIDISEV